MGEGEWRAAINLFTIALGERIQERCLAMSPKRLAHKISNRPLLDGRKQKTGSGGCSCCLIDKQTIRGAPESLT
jgi:hypothetical protein